MGATATGSGCSGSVTVCGEMQTGLLVSSSSVTVCVDGDTLALLLVPSSSVIVCIDTDAVLLLVSSSSVIVCVDMDAVVWRLVLFSSVAFCETRTLLLCFSFHLPQENTAPHHVLLCF